MRIFLSDFTLTWQADKWWRGCIYSARPQVTSARRCPAFTIWYAGQTHPLQHFTSRPVISGYFTSGFYCIYRQSLDKSWQIKWWNPENFRHTLSLSQQRSPRMQRGAGFLKRRKRRWLLCEISCGDRGNLMDLLITMSFCCVEEEVRI